MDPSLSAPLETALGPLHLELGAKMVPFTGYRMPLHYTTGIIQEHKHTREAVSLFDVSHMGQILISGEHAGKYLESVAPANILGLASGRQCYSYLTNDGGGIIDDLIIINVGPSYLLIVNAANKHTDLTMLREHCRINCEVELDKNRSLLALQGPSAESSLCRLAPETSRMAFMDICSVELAGISCIVARSGYTGEDGFEISTPSDQVESLARTLLQLPSVRPAGLGARDSLRLEAGLCLHGNDINPEISPVEADIGWAIPKIRRRGGQRAGGFPGADHILSMLDEGPSRIRVGIQATGRTPVRAQTRLETLNGQFAGEVTSGGFGPSVGGPVAMGYVRPSLAMPGTQLQAIVRNKQLLVTVEKLPFVPLRYHRR